MPQDLNGPAVERAAVFHDIKERAQKVTPIDAGRDILRATLGPLVEEEILLGYDRDGHRITKTLRTFR